MHNNSKLVTLVTWVTMVSTLVQAGDTGMIVTRGEQRSKREVGPMSPDDNSVHRKYRRLEHSIMVQADIRSR